MMNGSSVGLMQQWGAQQPVRLRVPFTYVAVFTNIAAAGGQQDAMIKAHADADFEVTKMVWSGFNAAAPDTDAFTRARVKIQLQDSGSSAQWFSDFVYIGHVAGDSFSTLSPMFTLTRQVQAASQIKVSIRNDMAATSLTGVRVMLVGNKLFR